MLNVRAPTPHPAAGGSVGASVPARRTRIPAVADLLANQAAWWWCVLWARDASLDSNGTLNVAIALLAPAAYLTAHLVFDAERRRVVALFALGAMLGWAGDSLLIQTGLIAYPGAPGARSAPAFMPALWAMFAVSLRASGRGFVRLRSWLRVTLAAVAGPIAYLGGQRLGVLELQPGGEFAVALMWAMVAPVLAAAAAALERAPAPQRRSPTTASCADHPSPERKPRWSNG